VSKRSSAGQDLTEPFATPLAKIRTGHKKGDFELDGVLDFATVSTILKQNLVFSDNSVETITIDLNGVSQSNSAGVALLVEWLYQARKNNKVIRFLNIPEQLLDIAKISALESILPTSA